MSSDEEWLKERVKYVGGLCLTQERVVDVEALLQFGRECIERGKAEQDKAVAAERERTLDAVIQAFEKGRGDVIARLANPDEALVEAVQRKVLRGFAPEDVEEALRALARTLEGKENSGE